MSRTVECVTSTTPAAGSSNKSPASKSSYFASLNNPHSLTATVSHARQMTATPAPSPGAPIPAPVITAFMNLNGLKIVGILDESGSMENIRDEILASFNEFITTQQNLKVDDATWTFVKFNDNVTWVVTDQPLDKVKALSRDDYCPAGCTALYDAIGSTIEQFKDAKNVIMAIVTDGDENASRKYSQAKVLEMINKYKTEHKWNFVYLSCDASTFKQGDNIGFATSANSSNCRVDRNEMSSFIRSNLNDAVKNYRTSGTSLTASLNQT